MLATLAILPALLSCDFIRDVFSPPDPFWCKVLFTGAELVSNDSVGNEWSLDVKVNDTPVEENVPALFHAGALVFQASATEDDVYPDTGLESIVIQAGDLVDGPYAFTISVIVTEGHGRYTGNSAEWVFDLVVIPLTDEEGEAYERPPPR